MVAGSCCVRDVLSIKCILCQAFPLLAVQHSDDKDMSVCAVSWFFCNSTGCWLTSATGVCFSKEVLTYPSCIAHAGIQGVATYPSLLGMADRNPHALGYARGMCAWGLSLNGPNAGPCLCFRQSYGFVHAFLFWDDIGHLPHVAFDFHTGGRSRSLSQTSEQNHLVALNPTWMLLGLSGIVGLRMRYKQGY